MELRIELDDATARMIEARVAAGRNTSAADVVRQALAELAMADEALDSDEIAGLRAALRVGERDIEEGRVHELTPELWDDIVARALAPAGDASQAHPRSAE